MRIGIHGGVSGGAENAIDDLLAAASSAHERGLDFWMGQVSGLDALTALAVVGRSVPGLRVGTAVVPTYPRHPMVMSMQALTVQASTGGLFSLGIGLSHRVIIEGSYGFDFDHPIRHMREYLEILMALLRDGEVRFEGTELTARTLGPLKVAGASAPPVVVAALGAQMLRLAGRMADGTVTWMVGPRTLEDHVVPEISRAAKEAGRPAPRVVVGLPVCVCSDPEAARERAARLFGLYNSLPSYRAMLDREGVEGPADVAVVGDDDAVAGSLRRLGELGATDLALAVFGSRDERARTMELLGELASSTPQT
jgi:5,10-methylenetetrahydromethanopterin reductase